MRKHKKQKKLLLFAGLISLVLFFGSTLLLFLLRYDNLWTWYEDVRKYLFAIEDYITGLDKTWEFIGAIMLLYFIKSFFPIYSTSTVCFLTGLVFPIYVAVPVNAQSNISGARKSEHRMPGNWLRKMSSWPPLFSQTAREILFFWLFSVFSPVCL